MLKVLLYADLLVSRAKREPCYFMFFRINVAIVVRTDFSSVFINQTSLSFEFKRLKLGLLFRIKLVYRHHSLISTFLAQAHGAWISFPPPPFLYYPPFFSKFSYKSFLFQNFHNHSFFLHLTISVDVIHHE